MQIVVKILAQLEKNLKDILKTKAQKCKKDELINKLSSEFNKFKNFGIDLNEASKTANKAKLTTKKAENIVSTRILHFSVLNEVL